MAWSKKGIKILSAFVIVFRGRYGFFLCKIQRLHQKIDPIHKQNFRFVIQVIDFSFSEDRFYLVLEVKRSVGHNLLKEQKVTLPVPCSNRITFIGFGNNFSPIDLKNSLNPEHSTYISVQTIFYCERKNSGMLFFF